MPAPRHALLALAVVGACACTSGNELGGIWRLAESSGDALIADPDTGESTVGLELLIGHYGPRLAGLLRFYRSREYDLPRNEKKPDYQCACIYMHDGSFSSGSGTARFNSEGCVPGLASQGSVLLRWTLRMNADGRLGGEVTVDATGHVRDGQVQELIFDRFASAGSADSGDKICETPSDVDAGNTYSGR